MFRHLRSVRPKITTGPKGLCAWCMHVSIAALAMDSCAALPCTDTRQVADYDGDDDYMPRGSMELPRHLRGSLEFARPSLDHARPSMDDGRPVLQRVLEHESLQPQAEPGRKSAEEPGLAQAAVQSSLYARHPSAQVGACCEGPFPGCSEHGGVAQVICNRGLLHMWWR